MTVRIHFYAKAFEKAAYRDDFLDGKLYMNTLGYFKAYEEQEEANVGDRFEAVASHFQPDQVRLIINEMEIPASAIAGPMIVQYNHHDYLNLCCLFCIHDGLFPPITKDNFQAFVTSQRLNEDVEKLGSHSVLIVNARAFQERVVAAVKRENFDATAGLVSYYDPAIFNGSFADEKIPFNKRDSYQHQREYRIALDRPDADGGPFTLEVGSLRDICAICPTSEINTLVEDCLQQLYRQGIFD